MIKGMYKDTIGVEFPKDLSTLGKAISIRHDIVHRNGKDKTGKMNEIRIEVIEELILLVKDFVKHVNEQLKSKETSST
ncbi:hypothetical protein J2T12_005519 [Paenibacillus anaericanus]|nr:hypothetical protein [Paenibacillus anaericanus]